MKTKIIITALAVFFSASLFSQGLISLSPATGGGQITIRINDIEMCYIKSGKTNVLLTNRKQLYIVNESLASIAGASCSAFLNVNENGANLLLSKNHLKSVEQAGTKARVVFLGGSTIVTDELYAAVLAQAVTPIGCGGGGGGSTNLGYAASPTNGVVTSSSGTSATIPLVNATNAGLMTPAMGADSHAPLTVTDAATVDFTLTGQALTAVVPNNSITNAIQADMAANTIKVNNTASSGDPADMAVSASTLVGRGSTGNIAPITLGSGLSMTGTVLSASSTSNTTATVNGGRFTYQVLSGTPVLTFDKSNPLTPTLTVAGGTIRLIEVRDQITTASSVNPVYTFNATWADALDVKPSSVVKENVSSGQVDIDNTPQVLLSQTGSTTATITINAVASDTRFYFIWNNL